MASKIENYHFYVAIKPYKLEGISDEYNEVSVYVNYDNNRKHFYASLHAGWCGGSFHGCTLYDGRGWLTDTQFVILKDSPKNSQKTINEMGAALELAKADIAWLFDERMFTQLQQFVKDVALYGYTAMLEERIRSYKNERTVTAQVNAANNSNNQTSEDKTMAQNVKAADLIGKTIVVGDNQGTIVIKSVQDNGMLACEFKKAGDTATTPLTVTMPNLQKMTERGLWKLQTSCVPLVASEQSSSAEVTTEADVAEVDDIVPVVKPRAKSDGGSKTADAPQTSDIKPQTSAKVEPIGKPKQEKPKAKTQPSAIKHQPSKGKYVYSTYQTSKGKTGAKITGVSETDAAYQQAAAIHASGSYTKDKDGNKKYYLCFGPRYAEAAKEVCKAMNEGKPIEDAIAVVNAATEERAAKREEWKQKREERKAKGYSSEDVAAMLRKVLAGGDVPEDIKAILAKAA